MGLFPQSAVDFLFITIIKETKTGSIVWRGQRQPNTELTSRAEFIILPQMLKVVKYRLTSSAFNCSLVFSLVSRFTLSSSIWRSSIACCRMKQDVLTWVARVHWSLIHHTASRPSDCNIGGSKRQFLLCKENVLCYISHYSLKHKNCQSLQSHENLFSSDLVSYPPHILFLCILDIQ